MRSFRVQTPGLSFSSSDASSAAASRLSISVLDLAGNEIAKKFAVLRRANEGKPEHWALVVYIYYTNSFVYELLRGGTTSSSTAAEEELSVVSGSVPPGTTRQDFRRK